MADNHDEQDHHKGDYSRGYYDKYGKWIEYADADGRAAGRRGPAKQGIVFAIFIIAVGVFLFLDNIGLFHFRDIWQFWPVALIALGAAKLFDCKGIGGQVWAAMWILVGTAFLLDHMGVWRVGWNVIWPLALIGFGVMMLTNALERHRVPEGLIVKSSAGTSADNTLREWATFAGIKRRIETQDFQGGEMVAVFGGIDIDLRHAAIDSAIKEVVIDANATFGGIELRVPENWIILMRGMGIFGGYEDKTIPPRGQDREQAPRLVIKGFAIFGGVSVQN
jgi:hypothetical protein